MVASESANAVLNYCKVFIRQATESSKFWSLWCLGWVFDI